MVRQLLDGGALGSLLTALFVSTAVTLALPTASAQAQEDVDDEEIGPSYSAMVVQNRKYDPTHEFSATLGLLPLDAFTKGLTLSGSYTLHFSQLVAWEIVQFSYSFPLDTDLKDELDAFDLRPTPFEVLNYYATTNFVWKPLYWKGSWLNDSLIYGEMFLTVGGGYGWFTRSGRPGLDLGVGFRIFGSELLSFRLDTRYLMFFSDFEQFDIKDELWIGLGTSLSF